MSACGSSIQYVPGGRFVCEREEGHPGIHAYAGHAWSNAIDVEPPNDLIAELGAERDSARATAVALEQELAVKDEALAEIAALAKEWHLAVSRDTQHCGGTNCTGCTLARCADQAERILLSLQSRLTETERQYDEQGSEA